MTDTHGMKFVVDTTGVAKGFRDYRSAVEGIFKSLDQFEAHVEKTMKGVASAANNKGALNSFKSAMSGFGKVDIDASAGKKISALSAAMAGFKAPSAAASANTKSFFKALDGLPNLGNVYKSIKSIDDLNIAMRGFKAPNLSEAEKLTAFANAVAKAAPKLNALASLSNLSRGAAEINTMSTALGRLKVPTVDQAARLELFAHALKGFNFSNLSGSANLFASLTAISNFKAPSPAQIRNLESFMRALNNLKVPANAGAITAAMANIAHAASSANGSLGGFRTNFGGFTPAFSRFGAGAKSATLNLAGLQNAFSGTFQVGSLLRSLLGSLTLGELARGFFETTQKANAFKAAMETISTAPGFSEGMWKKVSKMANDFGADVGDLSGRFSDFAVSAKAAGVDTDSTIRIFKGFQTAMTAMHMDASKQNQVGLAMAQMMNKGYIAAEEMNKQLNPILPGAFKALDEAVRKSSNGTKNLFDVMKSKSVDAKTGLEVIAKAMSDKWGPSMAQALMAPQQQFNILKSRIFDFEKAIADAGAQEGFARLLAKISSYLDPERTKKYAEVIGVKLKHALDELGKALDWVYVNWDKIKGPLGVTLGLLGKWLIVSTALKIGSTLVSPIIGVGRAAMFAAPLLFDMVRATKALAATNLTGYLTQLSKIKNPAIAGGAAKLSGMLGGAGAGGGGAMSSIIQGVTKVPGLFATATKAVGGYAAAIGIGLSAAWGIATGAQVDFADKAVGINYSVTEIMAGMWMSFTEWFSGLWTKLTKWFGSAWDSSVTMVTGLGTWMAEQLGFNFSDIGDIAAKTGFVIYYAFKKSLDAIVGITKAFGSIIGRTIGGIAGSLGKLFSGDAVGAGKAAMNVITGGTVRDGWNDGMGGFSIGGDDMRNAYADTRRGANGVAGFLNDMGAKGRGARGKPKPKPPEINPFATPDGLPPVDTTNLLGANGGKGNKKKKGGGHKPTLEDTENKVENAVDQLMKRLAGDDPVAKMYQDFVKGLTDEAHVLLSSNGYQTFLKNIKKDAADGKVTVDSLIAALQQGNLDSKTMADLKKRYGTDVKGIIAMLRQQQAEYEDAVKDATIKALDKKYKQVKDAAEVFGEDNPGIKGQQDLIDGLTKIARITLPTDQFKEFVTGLRDGSTDSAAAVMDLRTQVIDLATSSPQLQALLGSLGLTADQLAASIDRLGVKTKYARMQAEEEQTFGAKLLRTRQEQIMLNSLSARDAEIMTALQEEVNTQLAHGNAVSRETIEVTYQKLKAQQALADQMARNKTFFENNGVRSYINDVKDAGAAVNDLDKNVLQSLEDQLYSLGTTGKFSFKAIFDTIQQGIVRFASQQVTKKLVESVIPKDTLDGGSPTLFGGMFKAIGLGSYEPSKTQPLGSSVGNALWVQWTGQAAGAGIGGTGVSINGGLNVDNGVMGGLYTGTTKSSKVYVEGGDGTDTGGPANLLEGLGYGSGAANDNKTIAGGNPLMAANDNTAGAAVAKTAMSFKDSITGVLPMVGLAFAGSFKSPIAQIGAMFLSMMLTKMISGGGGAGGAGGGGGGFLGMIGGLFGGGGGGGSAAGALPGLFKEGGIVGAAVAHAAGMSPSAFANAPHYAEGTHNTSNGIPAVLHDNEAVIPLSRNRKVPIEMKGGGGTHITQNYVINTPDANSFKKSKQQIAVDSYSVANRAFRRNH